MHGLAAISAANGWAMAFAGALIVLSGLAVLSFIISQLYRVTNLLEKREPVAAAGKEENGSPVLIAPDQDLTDIEAATTAYQPLIDQLTQPFELKALYEIAGKNGFPHTHLTIKSFWEAGKLVSKGDGQFTWHPQGGPVEPMLEPVAAPTASMPAAAPVAGPAPVAAPGAPAAAAPKASAAAAEPTAVETAGTAVTAPMPGMIVRYEKQTGEAVSEGETVVILEAMKMENALPAPVSGTVSAIHFASGDSVAKEDVLCVID